MIEILTGIYIFAVGAVMGSFLNVCIGRWPEGLSIVKPRSRCPKCGHQITAVENISLVVEDFDKASGRRMDAHIAV